MAKTSSAGVFQLMRRLIGTTSSIERIPKAS
jgi:hypothetical protein